LANAQRTPLELRPKAGDTLRMRLDQTTEMSIARAGAPPRVVTTRTHMLSRAIVESEVPDGVYVLAITDSVVVSSSDPAAAASAEATRRQLAGRQMRLRIAPDGTVAMAEPSGAVSKAVNDLVAEMPASFPREPVNVGDSWTREMPIAPAAAARLPGANGRGGVARATFRLDSLSRQGELAYISMRGTLEPHPSDAPALPLAVIACRACDMFTVGSTVKLTTSPASSGIERLNVACSRTGISLPMRSCPLSAVNSISA
jgi:hypothetical protein